MTEVKMPSHPIELGDVQGLLRSAYRTLPHASYTLVGLGGRANAAESRRLLGSLTTRVTSAQARDAATVVQLALSASGLRAIGLPEPVLTQFALEFLEGMSAPARSRFLGDDPASWEWGADGSAPIDLLVCTYAATEGALTDLDAEIEAMAVARGATLTTRLTTSLSPTEPFGFRDGISDPWVAELASSSQRRHPPAAAPVALGEFVLGYPNAYGLLTQRPVLSPALDPDGVLPILAAGVDRGYPEGGRDLGRNGSYLVLRSLAQDVAGFRHHVETAAAAAGLDSGLLAAKMVGRWPSGAPLALWPDHDPQAEGPAGGAEPGAENSFGYAQDPGGLRCPVGAHIRRANPRDSLDPDPGSAQSVAVTDRHRIIRRGRRYGAPDGADGPAGLRFIALNANLGRQFEFVQHTWLNNPKFDGGHDDVDPLVGVRTEKSVFTLPCTPVRHRFTDLPDFVTTRGGGYFFLPGLRALSWLARGPS